MTDIDKAMQTDRKKKRSGIWNEFKSVDWGLAITILVFTALAVSGEIIVIRSERKMREIDRISQQAVDYYREKYLMARYAASPNLPKESIYARYDTVLQAIERLNRMQEAIKARREKLIDSFRKAGYEVTVTPL